MGASLGLLTAALLVGQTSAPQSNGKNCACNKTTHGYAATQGYVMPQPDGFTETQTASWWNWRSSSSTTTTTEGWRSAPSEGSWVDNRPVLSRIRGWFGRGESSSPRMEMSQPGGQVITQPAPFAAENYRRLPTSNEPPLNSPVAPAQVKPAAPARFTPPANRPSVPGVPTIGTPNNGAPGNAPPLTIEVEPIEFRAAGQAKGAKTPEIIEPSETPPLANVQPTPAPPANAPPSRPNPISPRLIDKVGQPGDYSWITGQLEIRGNTYVLHYATPETIDRYNGSLALATTGNLSTFRNGDLVSVHGNVVQQGRGAVYQVKTIDLVER